MRWFYHPDREKGDRWHPFPPSSCRPGAGSGLQIIPDEIEAPFRGFGKLQSSKARWRNEVRARGYEEVGNERREFDPKPLPRMEFRPDIARLIDG